MPYLSGCYDFIKRTAIHCCPLLNKVQKFVHIFYTFSFKFAIPWQCKFTNLSVRIAWRQAFIFSCREWACPFRLLSTTNHVMLSAAKHLHSWLYCQSKHKCGDSSAEPQNDKTFRCAPPFAPLLKGAVSKADRGILLK